MASFGGTDMTEQRGPAVEDDGRSDAEVAEAIDLPLSVVVTAKHRLARIISAPVSVASRRETLGKLIGDDELAERIANIPALESVSTLTAAVGAEGLPRLIDRIVGHSDSDFEAAVTRLHGPEHFIGGTQLPNMTIDLDRDIGSLTLAEFQSIAAAIGRRAPAPFVAAAPVAVAVVAAGVVSGGKLVKDYRDAVKDKSEKDHKDSKDIKDNKDEPDHKREKDSKDSRDRKDEKDLKDSREQKESKDAQDRKYAKDQKDSTDAKRSADDKQVKDAKDSTDAKHTKDVTSPDVGPSAKNNKDRKDAKDAKESPEGPPGGAGGGGTGGTGTGGSGGGSSGGTGGPSGGSSGGSSGGGASGGGVADMMTLRELFARLGDPR